MLDALHCFLGYGPTGLQALALARRWRLTERANRTELDRFQSEKLQYLLIAAARVPYWRELWQGKIPPAAGSDREWLREQSILTKSEIRRQGFQMLARGRLERGAKWCSTGGSTGEPLRIVLDPAANIAGISATTRAFRWHGIKPGAATVLVRSHGKISLLGQLRCRVGNFRLADPFECGQGGIQQIVRRIRAFGPACLVGYPTALLKLADEVRDSGLKIPVIFSTGEMLYPAQREKLEAAFFARVAVYYGCNEVNSLAYECEHGRLHVAEEHVILETVDDSGRPVWEQPGRILVTDLDNHVMPFLRYDVGDIGTLTREPCPCGRTLVVLKELQGRQQDVLRNVRGDVLPAIFFAGQFRGLRGVRAYQLVQKNVDEITLRFVPDGDGAETGVNSLCDAIAHRLGADVRIRRERCDSIPLTPRGKTRLVMGMNPADGELKR